MPQYCVTPISVNDTQVSDERDCRCSKKYKKNRRKGFNPYATNDTFKAYCTHYSSSKVTTHINNTDYYNGTDNRRQLFSDSYELFPKEKIFQVVEDSTKGMCGFLSGTGYRTAHARCGCKGLPGGAAPEGIVNTMKQSLMSDLQSSIQESLITGELDYDADVSREFNSEDFTHKNFLYKDDYIKKLNNLPTIRDQPSTDQEPIVIQEYEKGDAQSENLENKMQVPYAERSEVSEQAAGNIDSGATSKENAEGTLGTVDTNKNDFSIGSQLARSSPNGFTGRKQGCCDDNNKREENGLVAETIVPIDGPSGSLKVRSVSGYINQGIELSNRPLVKSKSATANETNDIPIGETKEENDKMPSGKVSHSSTLVKGNNVEKSATQKHVIEIPFGHISQTPDVNEDINRSFVSFMSLSGDEPDHQIINDQPSELSSVFKIDPSKSAQGDNKIAHNDPQSALTVKNDTIQTVTVDSRSEKSSGILKPLESIKKEDTVPSMEKPSSAICCDPVTPSQTLGSLSSAKQRSERKPPNVSSITRDLDLDDASTPNWKGCCTAPLCAVNDPTGSAYSFLLQTRHCCNRKGCQLAAKICDAYEPYVNIEFTSSPIESVLGADEYHFLAVDAHTSYSDEESAFSESDIKDIKNYKEVESIDDYPSDSIFIHPIPSQARRTSTVSWSLPAVQAIKKVEPVESEAENVAEVVTSTSVQQVIQQATADAQKFREAIQPVKHHDSILGDLVIGSFDTSIVQDSEKNPPGSKSNINPVKLTESNPKTRCCTLIKKKFRKKKHEPLIKLADDSDDERDGKSSVRSSIDGDFRRRYTPNEPVKERHHQINSILNNM